MPKITEMFAFISEDTGPEDEGVIAAQVGDIWMPLVGADMARVDSLRPIAAKIAKQTHTKVKLLHFTNREELETIS